MCEVQVVRFLIAYGDKRIGFSGFFSPIMTIYSSDSPIYPFNETPLLIYQDSVLLNSKSIKIYLYIRNITEIRKNLVSSRNQVLI